MRGIEPNNMAHLLLEAIPYCLYARSIVGPEMRVLSRPLTTQFSGLLSIFGILPLQEMRRVTGNFIRIRGTRGLAVYNLLETFDCNGITFFPDVYQKMEFSSDVKLERVFLARRGPRSLINQADVEKVLKKYGYKTIFMEDYSLRDQLSIGAQAKHVVALHGAAISLLIMNKKIDSVIELMPPNVYHHIFSVCLGPRVARYEQIIPEYDWAVPHSGWQAIAYFKNRAFATNANLLDKILSEIH